MFPGKKSPLLVASDKIRHILFRNSNRPVQLNVYGMKLTWLWLISINFWIAGDQLLFDNMH
jgi:hypothetical protein